MGQSENSKSFELLSGLLLRPPVAPSIRFVETAEPGFGGGAPDRICQGAANLTQGEFEALRDLATKNHVIMRSFEPYLRILVASGNGEAAGWVDAAMSDETARINHALSFLRQICSALEEDGCPVIVIKSLDHWP